MSLLIPAVKAMMNHNYDMALKYISNERNDDTYALAVAALSEFFTGRFEESCIHFKKFLELNKEDNIELLDNNKAKNILSLLQDVEWLLQTLPEIDNFQEEQSIEIKDNVFDEIEELDDILSLEESEYRHQRIEQLWQDIKDGTSNENASNKEKAHYVFLAAILHSCMENFDDQDAINNLYLTAISLNPNRALYYGYFTQHLISQKFSPISISFLVYRAILLEPSNPRWHLNQAIALSKLINMDSEFVYQVKFELDKALELVTDNQEKLKELILLVRENLYLD
ncbi:hypothetical protein CLOACE_04540 [Clostridium acetireducens DSM 10703]|jgi:tetratricopeptide (TPR) repeat protein|uniref:Tetratricopeptide repeat protein n=1 Tax=Clostridium acetireducens DSM 10703 TaxID=1121290 RepID=A0A1E8F0S3_9CLOT|nr:hypothetical protein [Clostridium acetireducens]OFI07049.1 hypothetical protein CLOACE_04540 [Clostridium acetireducens DSM 10703]